MRSSDRVAGYGIRWAAYQRFTRAGERGLKTRLVALAAGTITHKVALWPRLPISRHT